MKTAMNGWMMGCIACMACSSTVGTWAQTTLEVEVLAEDMTVPWDLVWGPDNHVWCMEKTGRITRTNPDTKVLEEVHALSGVYQSWDNSGAHAMALHPDFPRTPFIYVHYAYGEWRSRLSRLRYSIPQRRVVDEEVLIPDFRGNSSHNGSRLMEGPDGHLYMAMGDAYSKMNAQNLESLSGKILRMDWDGNAIPDNPYGNLIYSWGHRNPQGLVFSDAGQLYASEHGPATDDEVNLIQKGANYGWPLIEGPCDSPMEEALCDSLDARDPLASWSPTQAPCGMDYFDHPSIPEWENSLLLTFLKKQHLRILHLDETGTEVTHEDSILYNEYGRLRDVLVAPNGRVFVSTSNQEINGWNYLAAEEDDRILELVNPDFFYDALEPVNDLNEVFLTQLLETPQAEGKVFPQPAREGVSMFLSETVEQVDVYVYDMSGRMVVGAEPHALHGPGLLYVRLGALQTGLYVLEVRAENGERWTSTVLVKRD
ncbi:MAG: hypothetical protein CBC05_09465 [Crocinitomicaceae bacterium TMED45]|nr:MAG: hypothetical protein CBC05_09465 [Crocinitomicaceae bacterium TMED45]